MTIASELTLQRLAAVQGHTVRTLMTSQVLGGIGVASGIAVASLVAADVSGRDDLSGLASTTQVLGGALLTVPVAALMGSRGRRVGLVTAYTIGALGAAVTIGAAVIGSFWLLLVGTFLFGASTTANSQSRYAAVDLAVPAHRGRQLSLVVWATTVGSVLGPNMVGPAEAVSRWTGLPPLTGAWLFSAVGFLLAALVLAVRLRPDPLLTAREAAAAVEDGPPRPVSPRRGSVLHGLRLIAATPVALLGTLAITVGHVVMVSVMVMTPLHMHHGDAAVPAIGLVISVHILGMYGLSPVVGQLTDRLGPPAVILLGTAVLALAGGLAAFSPAGWSWLLLVALFLLGLGWSCTMVAGSDLVAGSVPVDQRPAVQGASDLTMGLSAAAAGALAGVVVAQAGYHWLGIAGVLLAAGLAAYTLGIGRGVHARALTSTG